mgnify:CR=1 FL=1
MAATSPTEIVRAFIAHVNDGDLQGIASLLSDTIMFIDAPGRVHRGDKNFMAGYLSEFQTIEFTPARSCKAETVSR